MSDDGPGVGASEGIRRDDLGNGLGLANVRERLTTMYGAHGRLELRPRAPGDGGGTLAVVTMPFRLAGPRP